MYEKKFGLQRRPFATTPDNALYYPATSHETALLRLRRALAENEGLALLTGAAGTGKTLLGLILQDALGADSPCAFLTNSHFPHRDGLLQAILYDLCLPYEKSSEQELRLRLTDFLLKTREQGKSTVLVIDEAQNLRADHLEELRLLGNLEAGATRAVQIVLLAQSGFLDVLRSPESASFRQRLSVRITVEPMGIEESLDYLLHHLRLAGGRPERVFDDASLEVIARGTRGIPRLLNQAAHQAMMLAEAGELPRVDAEAALEALAILGLDIEETPESPGRKSEILMPLGDDESDYDLEDELQEDAPVRLAEETRRAREQKTSESIVKEAPMGRMLEALKGSDGSRAGVKDRPFFEDTFENGPAPTHTDAAGSHQQLEERDDAIPFIEVGPNKKMEGSPQVMGAKHPHLQPPHQPAEKLAHVQAVPAPAPLTVAFETWPPAVLTDKGAKGGHGVAADIVAFHHPEHPVSKQYAILAGKMREGLGGPSSVLLLTGCRTQVGTSTVLLNLGVAAAQQNKGGIAIVDAAGLKDGPRPNLAQRLGCVSAAGLQDVFLGKLALEQAVVPTAIGGLVLVSSRPAADAQQLRSEAVQWLFAWLRERFSLVLVDAPSIDKAGELAPLARSCDGAYLVLPEGEPITTHRAAAQTLSGQGARLLGLFHTRANA